MNMLLAADMNQVAEQAKTVATIISFGSLIVAILCIASIWAAFSKANEPGWASIIPIFNVIVMLKIAGKPTWWVILFFIPVVNLVISILAIIAFCEAYGKGVGFALGLIFLPFIFWPLLGFGGAEFQGAPA